MLINVQIHVPTHTYRYAVISMKRLRWELSDVHVVM